MKQEQLSLETCREIGHLYPDSRSALYNGPHDEPTLLEKSESIVWDKLCDHPSITDMLRWLWGRSYRLNIWTSPEIYELQFYSPMNCRWGRTEFIQAASPIEAYAEAVKIVMKWMEK